MISLRCPSCSDPTRWPDGYENSAATSYLVHPAGQPDAAKSAKGDSTPVGAAVTANSEEFGGKGPIPAPADLGDFQGFKGGFKAPISMINGTPFKPGKAYKDSKLCTKRMSHELHRRFHEGTGIVFSTPYPGCVWDTPLFRNGPRLFQKVCPWFQKTITKAYVSQSLSGDRVAQVVAVLGFLQSGVHWSWGNRQKPGAAAFAQGLATKATDAARSKSKTL